VTRVEPFCEKCDSGLVTIFLNVTKSSPSHHKSWLKSNHWLESCYHCLHMCATFEGYYC